MFLAIAGALFLGFVANVAIGSVLGSAPLSDVAEALLLFGASIAFVVAVLRLEAARKAADKQDNA